MPEEVPRNTDPAGLENRDGRGGAMPEEVRIDRMSEGSAAPLGDDPGDSITGKRATFCAGP